ncbi:MAG: SDR family NAD(P)-dependent oxidoreductase, partial [Pseudomonadota bacterium]
MAAHAGSPAAAQDPPSLFAFGFGYCAAEIAAQLRAEGWRIAGSARSDDAAAKIAAAGGAVWRMDDGVIEDAEAAFADVTHLLLSIPPDADGDPALRAAGAALTTAPRLEWIGYLSTTGVYGDCGGAWVDETTPPRPTRERSRRRVDAEAAWAAFGAGNGVAVEIFRLGGIYGPGRG